MIFNYIEKKISPLRILYIQSVNKTEDASIITCLQKITLEQYKITVPRPYLTIYYNSIERD